MPEVYRGGFWMGCFNGKHPKRHLILSNHVSLVQVPWLGFELS